MKKQVILIIGAPGSGKTSTVREIIKNQKISHFSMGEIFRNEIQSNTEIGFQIKKYIEKAIPVPIAIAIDVVFKSIEIADNKIVIIDGYPRSQEQMYLFDEIISKKNKIDLKGVIEIDVSENIAKKRVLSRNRGNDDSLAIFQNRLIDYNITKQSIVENYKQKQLFYSIDGNLEFEKACKLLRSKILQLL